ncbi:MAG TPA: retropepsin-like aspartic protease [Allosphingosinicella sp.]
MKRRIPEIEMKLFALAAASALSACTAAGAPDAGGAAPNVAEAMCRMGFQAIPMRSLMSGHHIVEGTLNGKAATFAVDTGAGMSVLHAPYGATYLGKATSTASGIAIGAGGQTSLSQYPVQELTIAGSATGLKHIVAVDIATVVEALQGIAGKPIHGIIGQDVMRAQHALVDVQQSVLYLRPADGKAPVRTAAECAKAGTAKGADKGR